MADDGCILSISGITKAFSGVVALNDVSFSVKRGEIHGIVGENGAGKSTLMNILSGFFHPDHGVVEFDGAPVRFRDPRDAQQARGGHDPPGAFARPDHDGGRQHLPGSNADQPLGFVDNRRMLRRAGGHLAALGVEDIDPGCW